MLVAIHVDYSLVYCNHFQGITRSLRTLRQEIIAVLGEQVTVPHYSFILNPPISNVSKTIFEETGQ